MTNPYHRDDMLPPPPWRQPRPAPAPPDPTIPPPSPETAAATAPTRRERGVGLGGQPLILVLDDHQAIRAWVRDILLREGLLVIEARSGEEALQLAASGLPVSMALCDICLPGSRLDGLAAARELSYDWNIPCLMLTSMQEADAKVAATYAGALGYVLKDMAHDALLIQAVQAVLAGAPPPDPSLILTLDGVTTQQSRARRVAYTAALGQLTPREQEVARLMEQGLTDAEIAHRLNVAIGTIKTHVADILSRLHVSSRREVVTRAALVSEGGRS